MALVKNILEDYCLDIDDVILFFGVTNDINLRVSRRTV